MRSAHSPRSARAAQTFTRDNIFSFSQTAPYTITSWAPSTNGTVNSIQLTSDCTHAFIGGKIYERGRFCRRQYRLYQDV